MACLNGIIHELWADLKAGFDKTKEEDPIGFDVVEALIIVYNDI